MILWSGLRCLLWFDMGNKWSACGSGDKRPLWCENKEADERKDEDGDGESEEDAGGEEETRGRGR